MKQIEEKQQITFSATNVLVTDLSKLINHYSLSKTVTELQRSMHKSNNNGIITINLFNRFHQVTVDELVQSSRWYQGFANNNSRFEEDMEWSLACFEKNT